jgi:predicted transcriptional regulator
MAPLIPARPGERITFRATDAQHKALAELAKRHNATFSAVARAALDAGLAVLTSKQEA